MSGGPCWTLPVKLTDEEVAAAADQLAQVVMEHAGKTVEFEAARADWNEDKKDFETALGALEARGRRLSRVVLDRVEEREVPVEITIVNGQYRAVRKDTGEIVEERAATKDELQAELPL